MKKRLFQCIVVLLVCASMFFASAAGSMAEETSPAGGYNNTVNAYYVTVYFTGNEGLALKSAPSFNSERYLLIPEGTLLYLSQTSGYWGYTSYAGYYGWVYLKYTRIQGTYPTIQPITGYITPVYCTVYNTGGEGLELRKTPSAEDSTFGPLMDGTVVKAEAVSGEWVYAENNGNYGWCNTAFLRNSTQDEITRYEQMKAASAQTNQNGAGASSAPGANAYPSGPEAGGLSSVQNMNESGMPESSVPESGMSENSMPANSVPESDISENSMPASNISENSMPGTAEDASKMARSTCIAEYNGTTYIIEGYGTDLEPLPIEPAKYQYICSFAFYNDKVYYCCKEGGTSDYRMALYETNLDGTGQRELYAPEILDADMNHFALKNGFLYFRKIFWQNSQKMETWYQIDLSNGSITATQDVPGDVRSAVSMDNGYYVKDDRKFYSPNGSAIVVENADGSTEILAQPSSTFRLEGVTSAEEPNDLYVYYSSFVSGEAYLYRLKLSTKETVIMDSHMAVGGGIYFNW